MGCFSSKPKGSAEAARKDKADAARDKLYTPPKWKSDEPLTQADLEVRVMIQVTDLLSWKMQQIIHGSSL